MLVHAGYTCINPGHDQQPADCDLNGVATPLSCDPDPSPVVFNAPGITFYANTTIGTCSSDAGCVGVAGQSARHRVAPLPSHLRLISCFCPISHSQ